MKRKYIIVVLLIVSTVAATTVSGCGLFSGTNRGFPYPGGWTAEDGERDDADSGEKEESGSPGDSKSEPAPGGTENAKAGTEESKRSETGEEDGDGSPGETAAPKKPKAFFLLDTSGTMNREPEVNIIHMTAERACPGYQQEYYTLNQKKKIVKTDPEYATSGKYDNNTGAILDVLGEEDIPITSEGINILTTDLQTKTGCSKIGSWLAELGVEGFSFYVFSIENNNNVDFFEYTSSSVKEKVSVTECKFKRDFLMIVFGKGSLVRKFDEEFIDRFPDGIEYEQIRVQREDSANSGESLVKLSASRHFTDNLANITYENTRYVYGIAPRDSGETVFSWENTFVFKKNKNSANSNREAAKFVAFGLPETAVPEITNQSVTVLEYDSKKKSYVESNTAFDVSVEAFLDGIPAADDPDLNDKLGGNLVGPGKAAILVTIENTRLSKKLYAVEVVLTCKGEEGEKDFVSFARRHSAGLEEYRAALKTECVPLKEADGSESRNKYMRTAGTGSSVYSRLLEFERIADELDAASYVVDTGEKAITVRAIIDFR
ncbi:MAG: hypothetical protein Q4D81_01420 [Eubacteriales bacterium]|nr:hypothetical protein [Eubacteriales bacterium]